MTENMCYNKLRVLKTDHDSSRFELEDFKEKLVHSKDRNLFDTMNSCLTYLSQKDQRLVKAWQKKGIDPLKKVPKYQKALQEIKNAIKHEGNVEELNYHSIGNNIIDITFNTGIMAPISSVTTMSKNFPHLNFEIVFYEGSMDFCGKYIYNNGESKENIEYSPCSDENLNDIGLSDFIL